MSLPFLQMKMSCLSAVIWSISMTLGYCNKLFATADVLRGNSRRMIIIPSNDQLKGVDLAFRSCIWFYARVDADAVFGSPCDLAEVLKFFFSAENSEASCRKSFHLVFARHDLDRADE